MNTRKTTLPVLIALLLLGGAAIAAPSNTEWQVIKTAIGEDARPEAVRGESRWLKILITDKRSKEENVRITLPLGLVEGLIRLAATDDHHRFKCNGRELDVDILEILNQLKKAGPLALVEVNDGDEMIKIWIE